MNTGAALESVFERAATRLTSWLALVVLTGSLLAAREADQHAEALGATASGDGQAVAAPGPGIHIAVSSSGSIDITQIKPFEASGAPAGMTATMATGTRVSIEDEQYLQKLTRILQLMTAESEKLPLVEGDPTSPLAPTVLLRIEAPETHAFRTVQKIMEVCARREVMIWNIELVVLPSSGEKRSFATPLPGGDEADIPSAVDPSERAEPDQAAGSTQAAESKGRVEISIEVREAGSRVDKETGEAWSGEGPFRFEGRVLTYVVTADGSGGEGVPVEEELESPQALPEPGFAISIRTQEKTSLGVALDLAQGSYPHARVVIDAKPGTVYGDVVGVLDLVVTRFSSISFVGAR